MSKTIKQLESYDAIIIEIFQRYYQEGILEPPVRAWGDSWFLTSDLFHNFVQRLYVMSLQNYDWTKTIWGANKHISSIGTKRPIPKKRLFSSSTRKKVSFVVVTEISG